MAKQLELDLLKQKVLIIQSITLCESNAQLEKYIYDLSKVYKERSFLRKYKRKDIENAKILKEH